MGVVSLSTGILEFHRSAIFHTDDWATDIVLLPEIPLVFRTSCTVLVHIMSVFQLISNCSGECVGETRCCDGH